MFSKDFLNQYIITETLIQKFLMLPTSKVRFHQLLQAAYAHADLFWWLECLFCAFGICAGKSCWWNQPQVSISSTFYEQLLCMQIPKAQKKTGNFFALWGSLLLKAAHRTLMKLAPGRRFLRVYYTKQDIAWTSFNCQILCWIKYRWC